MEVYANSPSHEGLAWDKQRKIIIDILQGEFRLKVFDPYNDPKQHMVAGLKGHRENKDYEKIAAIAKVFVAMDLNCVNWADIVIGYVPSGVPTVGCVHEVVNANAGKKLVLLVEGTDKAKISLWYYGFIKPRFMFDTWDSLFAYFREINQGLHQNDNRLSFLYNYPTEWLS
jgi:hypothetical protein